ncbi:MAG: hypothetical protein HXX13_16135 [Bacteroidetes bacterium]|nr:hypothetical protein [Bacteroidota bacterium]
MRFVVKPESDKTDKLKSAETYAALLDIAKNKNKAKITSNIYRDPYKDRDEIRSAVEDKLALSYKNKCAYCERLCKADIEHYRPKKGVDNEMHDGYYWLCYEWTNLIPSCEKCNRDGGKHNKFPILGKRVKNPIFKNHNSDLNLAKNKAYNKPLIDEVPFLLHPEIDKPEDFFEFEIDHQNIGIRIKGIDKNNRGTNTIEICKLNRQILRIERRENVIDGFCEALNCYFIEYENGTLTLQALSDKIIDQIKILITQSKIEKKTHTFLRKYIVLNRQNFKQIVIPFIEPKIKLIVESAFNSLILI